MQVLQKKWPYLLFILVLNLLQSFGSELAHDEAYYWVYSQQLDWGYFDHPPAIALLVSMGYGLLQNELGVRLFVVLINLATIMLMYKIVKPTNAKLFFLMLFSCVITHVGFLAVPDVPLLFTVALFFFIYKKYLEGYDYKNALWLGLTIAAMGYSKYHGIIILVSVLLSNLNLLKEKSFYLAVSVAALCYFPHLYWQYAHDFPTFRFHLFDRSSETYSFIFVGEYILGQLLIFGPLIGALLFWSAYKFKSDNQFERSLSFTFYGIFGFFLLSSLKGRVEPNWTAMAMVPLIYLAYHYISTKGKLITWVYRLSIPSLVLIIAFRLTLIVEVLPPKVFPLGSEFHGWKAWAKEIETIITRRPALFFNSYQRAAKYSFYSNGEGFSINTSVYAGSQYDLLTAKQGQLQGRRVALMHLLPKEGAEKLIGGKDHIYIEPIEQFFFYNRLKVKVDNPPEEMKAGASTTVEVKVCNTTNTTIVLQGNKDEAISIGYVLYEKKTERGRSEERVALEVTEIVSGQCLLTEVFLQAPVEQGVYRYRMSIFNGVYDERNDNFHTLRVVD